jgi:hypothetical protein
LRGAPAPFRERREWVNRQRVAGLIGRLAFGIAVGGLPSRSLCCGTCRGSLAGPGSYLTL